MISPPRNANEPTGQDIGSALKRLGLGNVTNTDPNFMSDLLKDIDLDGFVPSNPRLKKMFQDLRDKPVALDSIKNNIFAAIAKNAPLANTILAAAKMLDLTGAPSKDAQAQIKYSIHLMVILEVFTTLMVNDKSFSADVVDHLLGKRGVKNPGNMEETFMRVLENTGDIFAPVKLCSVDPGAWRFRCWREHDGHPTKEQVDAFIEKYKLTGMNASVLRNALNGAVDSEHRGLRANIYEAVLAQTNLDNGGRENAQVGVALISALEHQGNGSYEAEYVSGRPVEHLRSDDEFWKAVYDHKSADGHNVFSKIHGMPKEWIDAYITWNMAFIANKFPEVAHITAAKLFIPSTLSADPQDYMATRVLSLWLTVNFVNSLYTKKPKQGCKLQFEFPQHALFSQFMKIYGEQNLNNALANVVPLAQVGNQAVFAIDDKQRQSQLFGLYQQLTPAEQTGFFFNLKLGLGILATIRGNNVATDPPFYVRHPKVSAGFLAFTALVLSPVLIVGGIAAACFPGVRSNVSSGYEKYTQVKSLLKNSVMQSPAKPSANEKPAVVVLPNQSTKRILPAINAMEVKFDERGQVVAPVVIDAPAVSRVQGHQVAPSVASALQEQDHPASNVVLFPKGKLAELRQPLLEDQADPVPSRRQAMGGG